MANEKRRLSDLPQASVLQGSDRIVFLQNSASTPMARTISFTNFANSISTLHNSGQSVALSNSGALTFTNGAQIGANIEGDPVGFDVYSPSTLDYVSMTYGPNPVSGNSSYITLYKTGSNSASSPHALAIQLWKGDFSADFAQWTFNANNMLMIPGPITGATQLNQFTGTTVELDVTKTINKLTPNAVAGAPHYHLANGAEGQIMYLTPNDSGPNDGSESTTMSFNVARWTTGGYVNVGSPVTTWKPFHGNSAVVTLIFTDGAWNLPHAVFS